MSDQVNDPHVPFVQALAAAGDWAGLVRYWMAHGQYAPALDLAVRLVSCRAHRKGEPWINVVDYLGAVRQRPIDLQRRPPQLEGDALPAAERATLDLTFVYALARLCEIFNQAPVEMQQQALEGGIRSADAGGRFTLKRPKPSGTSVCSLWDSENWVKPCTDASSCRHR